MQTVTKLNYLKGAFFKISTSLRMGSFLFGCLILLGIVTLVPANAAESNPKLDRILTKIEKLEGNRKNIGALRDLKIDACEFGHSLSCSMEFFDEGLQARYQDFEKRLDYYQAACDANPTEACGLVIAFDLKYRASANTPEANIMRQLLERGCGAGGAQACRKLANSLAQFRGFAPDVPLAVRYHERACELEGKVPCTEAESLLNQDVETLGKKLALMRAIYTEKRALEKRYPPTFDKKAVPKAYIKANQAKDSAKRRALYIQACEEGYVSACASADDQGLKPREVEPVFAARACDEDYVYGCTYAAEHYFINGLYQKAEPLLRHACFVLHDAGACDRLATLINRINEHDQSAYLSALSHGCVVATIEDSWRRRESCARLEQAKFNLTPEGVAQVNAEKEAARLAKLNEARLLAEKEAREKWRLRNVPFAAYPICMDTEAKTLGVWLDNHRSVTSPDDESRAERNDRIERFMKKCGGSYSRPLIRPYCSTLSNRPAHHNVVCSAYFNPGDEELAKFGLTFAKLRGDFNFVGATGPDSRGHLGPAPSLTGEVRVDVEDRAYFGLDVEDNGMRTVSAMGDEHIAVAFHSDHIVVSLKRSFDELTYEAGLDRFKIEGGESAYEFAQSLEQMMRAVGRAQMFVSLTRGPAFTGAMSEAEWQAFKETADLHHGWGADDYESNIAWDADAQLWIAQTKVTFDMSDYPTSGDDLNSSFYVRYTVRDQPKEVLYVPITAGLSQAWLVARAYPQLALPQKPSEQVTNALVRATSRFQASTLDECTQTEQMTRFSSEATPYQNRYAQDRAERITVCGQRIRQTLIESINRNWQVFGSAKQEDEDYWLLAFMQQDMAKINGTVGYWEDTAEFFEEAIAQQIVQQKIDEERWRREERLAEKRRQREAKERNKRNYKAEYEVYVQAENQRRMQQGLPPLGIGVANSRNKVSAKSTTSRRSGSSGGSGGSGYSGSQVTLSVSDTAKRQKEYEEEQEALRQRAEKIDRWREEIENDCAEYNRQDQQQCTVWTRPPISEQQQKNELRAKMSQLTALNGPSSGCKVPEFEEGVCLDLSKQNSAPMISCPERSFDDLNLMMCTVRYSWTCNVRRFPADEKGRCPSVQR